MKKGPRIVLIGDSILMDSVAESLATRRVSGVIRTAYINICDQFEFLKPNLIIFELGFPYSDRVIALLPRQPGLAMIGLDLDCSRVIVLGGYQRDIGNMEDLYQVIQAEMRRQKSGHGEVNRMG